VSEVFVDSSAWLPFVDRADVDHADVTAALAPVRGRLVTSNFVLDETLTLLRYRYGWHAAHKSSARGCAPADWSAKCA
jgi:uncharacterized protein